MMHQVVSKVLAVALLCAVRVSAVLDVMLLPHSHQVCMRYRRPSKSARCEPRCCHAEQDAGFLVTYSHVRDTLADRCYRTIFECLSADPSKTFNVAEVRSFS